VAAFGTWQILEKTLDGLSDRALSTFSDQLFVAMSKWPQAQAAVRLQQSRSLFSRLLLTDARFCLLEAEDLAKQSLADKCLGVVYQEKLFSRGLYREWRFWFEDALDAFLELSRSYVSTETRRHFAGLARSFAEANQEKFGSTIADLKKYWPDHSFEVAMAAVLKAASRFGIQTEPVSGLANWLRANAPFPTSSN
jgi:hypothetical protein